MPHCQRRKQFLNNKPAGKSVPKQQQLNPIRRKKSCEQAIACSWIARRKKKTLHLRCRRYLSACCGRLCVYGCVVCERARTYVCVCARERVCVCVYAGARVCVLVRVYV